MGQCWSRPRRRFKVRPVGSQETTKGRCGRYEVSENEAIQNSSAFVLEVRANSERSLNSLSTSNSVCTPRKLPPLPPDVMVKNEYMRRYMYQETQKWKAAERRKQERLEREFSKATKTVKKQQKQSIQAGKEKQSSNKVSPYWKLQDVPIKPFLKSEDVKNGMKTIDSEMSALLKPDEKYRSISFTVGKVDRDRSQTPGCVPQRLLKHQKAKVDRVQLLEKQRDAERRRNANIAKRVQSARQRSAMKKPNVPTVHEAEREKNLQVLKNHASDKMESAHARRSNVIKQRVKVAKKSGSIRKQPENESKYKNEVKLKVDSKMKGATDRRNEILSQKAQAAKKEGRTELVNEREKEIADVHRSKLEVKLNKIKENKERVLRRKLRSLEFQAKKRELARKTLARQRQEDEEICHTFFETETYDGDDDLGEHYWD